MELDLPLPSIPTRVPRAVRASRRLARTGLFVAETLAHGLSVDGTLATPRERARHLAWVAENLCALHGIEIVAHGRIPDGPCIYVANHVSYLEPIALLARVPATAVAKRELAAWPLLGETARALGVLFVDRGCAHSGARVLVEAWRRLEAGVSILVFPEGTTTRGDEVLPFRRGIFGLARLANVPVVPVAVRYDRPDVPWVGDDAFLPHYVRTAAHGHTCVHLAFGEPIDPRSSADDAEGLGARARDAILARLS